MNASEALTYFTGCVMGMKEALGEVPPVAILATYDNRFEPITLPLNLDSDEGKSLSSEAVRIAYHSVSADMVVFISEADIDPRKTKEEGVVVSLITPGGNITSVVPFTKNSDGTLKWAESRLIEANFLDMFKDLFIRPVPIVSSSIH